MAGALLVGYGNTLRRDDGLGPHVAGLLQAELERRGVRVITCQTLTPELAADLALADFALFVDALASEHSAGASVEPVEGQVIDRALSVSTEGAALVHFLSPQALLAWTLEIYGRAPAARLVGLRALDIGFGEGLSVLVAGRLPALLDRVRFHFERRLCEPAVTDSP